MELSPGRYQPILIKAHPWPNIQEHYADLVNSGWHLQPMLELVTHIIASDLRTRLFAFASLDGLIISIYDPIERNREALHLKFDHFHQKWLFEYYPKPNHPVEWRREYPTDQGIEKFENFIRLNKW